MIAKMRLIIAGGRDFDDVGLLRRSLRDIAPEVTEVVCGACRGADALGERWALKRGIRVTYFQADWAKYGKSAGPIRNRQMAFYADALLAFWDGRSKGTRNMIELAYEHELGVAVVGYGGCPSRIPLGGKEQRREGHPHEQRFVSPV